MAKKELKYEEYKEMYKTMGSNFFEIQQEAAKDWSNNQLKIYFSAIDFVNSFITTVGVLAGFGFAAFGNIENKPFFFIGELLLISIIIYALYWVHNTYVGEYNGILKAKKDSSEAFKDHNQLVAKINQEYGNTGAIDTEDIQKLPEADNKILAFFTKSVEEKPLTTPIPKLIILTIVATLLILISLFAPPFEHIQQYRNNVYYHLSY